MGNFVHFWRFFRIRIHIPTNIWLWIAEIMQFRLIFHIKLVSCDQSMGRLQLNLVRVADYG